jgi:uncharacterized protein YqgV (UPF0045/DUF77 family)
MKVQAQMSIYPLKVDSLSGPIEQFCGVLETHGLEVQTRQMCSYVTGESDIVFKAVKEAFDLISGKYGVVMDLKVSNACPAE